MRRLLPDTIATRTLLVLVVGLTVSHLASVALFSSDRTTALMMTGGEHTAERITTITGIVENAPEAERQRIVKIADESGLRVFRSAEAAIADARNGGWQTNALRRAFVMHLRNLGRQEFRLRLSGGNPEGSDGGTDVEPAAAGGDGELLVSVRLTDGSWLNFAAPLTSSAPLWSFRSLLSMAVMLVAVVLLSALVVRKMTEPMATLAYAAGRIGTNVNAPPIPERGPAEVRQAVRAFNEMQERIRRFVEDRTQMLAAISHDLGTPITRLRLRAEFVEDEEQRHKMLADLDAMERMVSSALSFARDDIASEPHVMVDLASLLQRVCDDIVDAGQEVHLTTGGHPVPFGCRPAALRRAFTNLIENAVKYGDRARVSLSDAGEAMLVTIDDDGPGIPEDLREEAFKPFRRLDTSRSAETGGTGLGLTVARTIVRAHGGDIALGNRPEHGLRAEIVLPR